MGGLPRLRAGVTVARDLEFDFVSSFGLAASFGFGSRFCSTFGVASGIGADFTAILESFSLLRR